MRPIDQIADLLDELLLKAGTFAFLGQGLAVSSSGWNDPELKFHQEQILLSPNAIAKKNGRDNFTDDELLELVSLLQTSPHKVELLDTKQWGRVIKVQRSIKSGNITIRVEPTSL